MCTGLTMKNREGIKDRIIKSVGMIMSQDPKSAQDGWQTLQLLNSEEVRKTMEPEEFELIIQRQLVKTDSVNAENLLRLLTWFANFVSRTLIRRSISECIREVRNMTELADFIHALKCRHDAVFTEERDMDRVVCSAIVFALQRCKPDSDRETKTYKHKTIEVLQFLKDVRDMSRNSETFVLQYLEILDSIIFNKNEDICPSLAIILSLVEDHLIDNYVDKLQLQLSNKMENVIVVLYHWIIFWPHLKSLTLWLQSCIKCLERNKQYTKISDIFQLLFPKIKGVQKLPIYKDAFLDTLYTFYSISRSLNNFNVKSHDMITWIKTALPVKPEEVVAFEAFARNIHGWYSSKGRDRDDPEMINFLAWLYIQWNSDKQEAFKEILSSPWIRDRPEEKMEVDEDYYQRKIEKVGLNNLGNTCYMNSVLQALFMTRQFAYEILASRQVDYSSQHVLKTLQNLFALLTHSKRISYSPTEVFQASKPSYFLPGQQQDSSEFLCHLLDILYEQEKAAYNSMSLKPKIQTTETTFEDTDDARMNRWSTEEDLSEGGALERKTKSLGDFKSGDDLSSCQSHQLNDSRSDSSDSGIQSFGGEETPPRVSYLVHRVFGGETKTTYQCLQCNRSSHNTDKFRDLQLCFPEELDGEVKVQDLINYFLSPEDLKGDNKYHCEKCNKLCDATKTISIHQAPTNLILTLKHFRYNSETRLRTKLSYNVIYNETIQLPLCADSLMDNTQHQEYHLYAAVVHSGYSMDRGHYFTYARNSDDTWFKFNDSHVSHATISELKSLKPPDTPYILFYEKSANRALFKDTLELQSLSLHLQDLVRRDNDSYKSEQSAKTRRFPYNKFNNVINKRDDDLDDDNPPSNCGNPINLPHNHYLC